ncbi:unnamed protein product [Mytilus coruscus]|uniref:SLC46A1 n=1 Tax=Mytilus coruscus TaxID=42192 RepID=A0A6J8EYN9_MYTCO|nr:unnamed protein product [Mytilus coruscus]
MDERVPLLLRDNNSLQQKKNTHKSEYTKAKISLFVMINYFAVEFAGLTQPQYIYSYLENERESNNTSVDIQNNISSNHLKNCFNKSSYSTDESRERASSWTWYISLAEYGVAFPVLFYIGPLTDRIGRKPLLLYNTVMVFISFILKTIVVYGRFPLQYYVAASAVEGLAGTPFAFNLINHAIIADTTTLGNDRSLMMTIYDALLGLGAICSNIATGYLIQLLGFTYPYLVSSGMLFILPILIFFTLEETWKPPKDKSKTSVFKLPIKNFTLCFKRQHVSNKLGYFIANLFILLLVIFPYTSISSILTLFLLGEPFCWTSEHIGWYNAGVDFVKYLGGTTILKIMHSCCVCLKDEIIIVFAMLSSIAYLILLGFSNNDWMVYGGKSEYFFGKFMHLHS